MSVVGVIAYQTVWVSSSPLQSRSPAAAVASDVSTVSVKGSAEIAVAAVTSSLAGAAANAEAGNNSKPANTAKTTPSRLLMCLPFVYVAKEDALVGLPSQGWEPDCAADDFRTADL